MQNEVVYLVKLFFEPLPVTTAEKLIRGSIRGVSQLLFTGNPGFNKQLQLVVAHAAN